MDIRRRKFRKPAPLRRRKTVGDIKLSSKTLTQSIAGAALLVIVFFLNLIGIDLKQNFLFKNIDYQYIPQNIAKFSESHDIAVFFETPIEENEENISGNENAETEAPATEVPSTSDTAISSESEITPEEGKNKTDEIPNSEIASENDGKLMYSPNAANEFSYLAVTDDRDLMLLTDLMENDDTTFNPDELPKPEQVLKTAPKLAFSYVMPVKGYLSSNFGYRIHPIQHELLFHFGIDLAASMNTSITAFASGTVAETGYTSYYGNYVKILHSGGILSFYGHCNKIVVKKGQKVSKGAKIAYVGSTGESTGPHLHFELRKGQNITNPEGYFKGKL
jgi:murein DD-endopeptidase MepM/ murein hydrolase activator NlpD